MLSCLQVCQREQQLGFFAKTTVCFFSYSLGFMFNKSWSNMLGLHNGPSCLKYVPSAPVFLNLVLINHYITQSWSKSRNRVRTK